MNGAMIALIVVAAVVFILILVLISSIRIVRQTEECIVERFGKYLATWKTGIHFLVPFADKVIAKVSLKEQIHDFPPKPVITKDNVTMQIDSIVFFRVLDPKLYAYGVEDPIMGIEALTSTTMRNLIGDLDLDDTLTSRDYINNKMRAIIDEATDPWGIKVTRVEVKNILPPRDIQEAMEKQMRAEREKREKILIAEGEKTSAITIAEGRKEAAILTADAEKQTKIMHAEAEAEAILKIKKAQADGELMVRTAEAKGIELINEAYPTKEALALRSLETMEKVADGKATKIIVPSNLQDITSYLTVAKDILAEKKEEEKKEKEENPQPKVIPSKKMPFDKDTKLLNKNTRREENHDVNHVYQQHP